MDQLVALLQKMSVAGEGIRSQLNELSNVIQDVPNISAKLQPDILLLIEQQIAILQSIHDSIAVLKL